MDARLVLIFLPPFSYRRKWCHWTRLRLLECDGNRCRRMITIVASGGRGVHDLSHFRQQPLPVAKTRICRPCAQTTDLSECDCIRCCIRNYTRLIYHFTDNIWTSQIREMNSVVAVLVQDPVIHLCHSWNWWRDMNLNWDSPIHHTIHK